MIIRETRQDKRQKKSRVIWLVWNVKLANRWTDEPTDLAHATKRTKSKRHLQRQKKAKIMNFLRKCEHGHGRVQTAFSLKDITIPILRFRLMVSRFTTKKTENWFIIMRCACACVRACAFKLACIILCGTERFLPACY